MDLSRIDFEALRARFAATSRKRTELERLRALVSRRLEDLVRLNRSRADFLARYQAMIDEYNAGSLNVEQFFEELLTFTRELNEEERRGIAEGLSEEELALFDLLTKPEPKLTRRQEVQVKRVVKTLLETLKREKLVLDWRKRQQTREAVRLGCASRPSSTPCRRIRIRRRCTSRNAGWPTSTCTTRNFGPGASIYGTAA